MRSLLTRRSLIASLALTASLFPAAADIAAASAPQPAVADSAAGNYHPLDPARILDTRIGTGASGAVGPGQTASLQVTGRGAVPAQAGAVILNVTAVQPTHHGYLTVFPGGTGRPTASNLNFTPGQVVPNLVVAKLGDNGTVDLFNSAGHTHLVADVMGWFDEQPSANGSRLRGISPTRLVDTRDRGAPIGPGRSIELQVADTASIPAEATAVVLNVTVTQPTAAGYLTVYPNGVQRPTASNLNFVPGQTVPNLVVAKVGTNGKIRLYNSHGSSHVIVDATAFFQSSNSPADGAGLTATNPDRLLDTREGLGAARRKVRAGESISIDVTGRGGVPQEGVDSVVLNVTVTDPTHHGYVTAHPSGTRRPEASNLNFVPGQTVPNLVVVKVGADGRIDLFNSHGETHLVADIAGWFGTPQLGEPTPPPTPPGPTPEPDPGDPLPPEPGPGPAPGDPEPEPDPQPDPDPVPAPDLPPPPPSQPPPPPGTP